MKQRQIPALPTFALIALAPWISVGCASPAVDDTAQRAVMHDLAYEVMLPIVGEIEAEATKLSASVGALCDAPTDDTLKAAQAAWRAARKPWKRSEPFRFGPAEDLRLGAALDFWPARPDTIEAAITAAPEPVTPEHIASLGTSSKGLPALEYLIFDPMGGNAAVLASLGAADPAAQHRCGYARALAETLEIDAKALNKAWSPEGDAFVDQVANAGRGSALFPSSQDGLSKVINVLAAFMQQANETKLSTPLGAATGTPDPNLVESPYSDNSIDDLLANVDGVEDLYLGKHGEHSGKGLTELVVARSSAIDATVKKSLADARAKVAALPAPLRTSVTGDPTPINVAHEAMRTARRSFSTDVASVLGITITLNDNDGD